MKSSPVIAGDLRADRLVRHAPLRARRGAPASSRWKLQTDGPVHATPAVVERHRSTSAAATSGSAPSALTDGKVLFEVPLGRLHRRRRRSIERRPRLPRHVQQRGGRASICGRRRSPGATAIRTASFPTTRRAALGRRPRVSSADATRRSTRSTRRPASRAWKFVTRARVDSSPAIAGGRVFVGSSDGKLYVLDAQTGAEAVGVRRRRRAHRVAGHRRRPRGDRRAGRPALLFRVT